MKPPAFVTPFFEPDAVWYDSPPPDPGPGGLAALGIAAVVFAVLVWESATVPHPLAGQPVSTGFGWLLAGGAVGLVTGAWLGRPDDNSASNIATVAAPRLPVFLRFDGRRVVVVGGGPVAAAKIAALLEAGADVTVVAPTVVSAIDASRVRVVARQFVPADLDGAWFVTAAATPEVNRQVREAAEARRVFVNAVDDPANATAYLGGTILRGGVTIAVSTAGQAPALAGLLREALDQLLPDDLDAWAAHAHDLSRRQRAEGVPIAERRPQLLVALNRLYESRANAGAEAGARS